MITRQPRTGNPRFEVADIFRRYGPLYRHHVSLPRSHRKVMHAIEVCRTSELGGHLERCDSCGYERNAYNSCRNRHCPKCQSVAKADWLEKRKAELLPVDYFHTVFTIPHELNPITLCNKKIVFDILFKAVAETLTGICLRSQTWPGRQDRIYIDSAYMGPETARSLSPALCHTGRRINV